MTHRTLLSVGAFCAIAVAPISVNAGPHLGMKMACRDYANAWNSGSRRALLNVVTGRFARAWARLPEKEFAEIPRRAGGGSVLASRKGRGIGWVTVATAEGPVTFVVVGRGFRWTVDDILRPDSQGNTVSVADSLHATGTVRDFVQTFSSEEEEATYRALMSAAFQQSFDRLSENGRNWVRRWLRPQGSRGQPQLVLRGDRASIVVAPEKGQPDDKVHFELVRQAGEWKVDDVRFDTARHKIDSYRDQLPLVAAVAGFREFTKNPGGVAPDEFASGPLHEELASIHRGEASLPDSKVGGFLQVEMVKGSGQAVVRFENAALVLRESKKAPGRIDAATIAYEDGQKDLASVLAVNRKLEQAPGGKVLASFLGMFDERAGE